MTSQGNESAPGRTCTCVVPFRRRMPGLLGHESVVSDGNGRAPRCCPGRLLIPSQAGSLAPSRASVETGSLCGHCSRDLPLDRRLLFVAELTGYEMVRRPGIAPGRSTDSGFTIRLASLANYRRVKLVDCRGFAPRSPACEAGDLLTDRAAL